MPSIEFTKDEFDELWDWYVMPSYGVPWSLTFGSLLNRMDDAVHGRLTLTLPGPNGLPNQEVPLDGDFEHLTAAWDA